ncbi:MAG: hypothetical protein DBX39_03370 [Bacillota bacterium]|nr:MAG: hypothetical protein DBX39_03370 [Bacillota bacterium]
MTAANGALLPRCAVYFFVCFTDIFPPCRADLPLSQQVPPCCIRYVLTRVLYSKKRLSQFFVGTVSRTV